ncbi:MAG: DUF3298 domain-containing protein [Reyranella sp.]|uniref:DUF3298 domain-containing protein n=1 Tax=Reyranella sp. TaxID=1929291 RepID=UPI003D104FA9
MRVLIIAIAVTFAVPALAQRGPSFDCSKASNAIERTICKEPELATADRELAAAYGTLVGRLGAAAKDHLAKDQIRWITSRNRDCAAEPDEMMTCIKSRYAARTTNLGAFGEGAYPFLGARSIEQRGKLGQIRFSYSIEYPQFDGTTADFSAINASYAAAARKAAENATPKAADSGVDGEQGWTYQQSFEVYRPGPEAVTIVETFDGYSGGAHGFGGKRCTLVDLRTGRSVGPAGVFAAGDAWLSPMVRLVGADLKKQFVEKPGFEDALEPKSLAKLLGEARHYCWKANQLELVFNPYEVGPYVSGPYEVTIPYDRLRTHFRPGGPIAR